MLKPNDERRENLRGKFIYKIVYQNKAMLIAIVTRKNITRETTYNMDSKKDFRITENLFW
jgi:hypothetical protein